MAASYLYRIYGEKMFELGIGFIDALDTKKWVNIKKIKLNII